jgi:hypothetical protein
MLGLAQILNRSVPTANPDTMFVFMNWSGRALGSDGVYIGADVMADYIASYGNGLSTNGDVFYISNGTAAFSNANGMITSYNPSYRAFAAQDQDRVIELLKQWQETQREIAYGGADTEEEVTIGD